MISRMYKRDEWRKFYIENYYRRKNKRREDIKITISYIEYFNFPELTSLYVDPFR